MTLSHCLGALFSQTDRTTRLHQLSLLISDSSETSSSFEFDSKCTPFPNSIPILVQWHHSRMDNWIIHIKRNKKMPPPPHNIFSSAKKPFPLQKGGVLRSAVGKTHDLRSDLWWTIPLHILLDRFGIPSSSYLRVYMGCALAFVLQVRSLYVPCHMVHS